MGLDIKIVGLEDVYNQDVYDYYDSLAGTLNLIYSNAYPKEIDYHYKKLDFTLVVSANLKGRCFDFVRIDGVYNKHKHIEAMQNDKVRLFFKAV
ncbi:hypothetical protein [Wenyingzhuangia marina]|uniref:Uncharacterized protein n=1 Tax=Wenyingzhuangia marina TaxID=1195760 RepID=A0A1M5T4I0_9FLAO|nr:hypothetical protein [Wenyingzhuangia marina]GGF65342.1 hypothetical protein GCM10011397_05440 [Wenyingzhuangia marina]SHH45592.1 hypothetical protein SAMN05444281_0689 [Wenyingzhuangia marina]